MHTATKVVLVGSFICSFTSLEVSRIRSIRPKMLSRASSICYLLPKMLPTLSSRELNFYLKLSNLFSPFSKMLGKLRNRRVWPVGAVSNTITSKSIFSIELNPIVGT